MADDSAHHISAVGLAALDRRHAPLGEPHALTDHPIVAVSSASSTNSANGPHRDTALGQGTQLFPEVGPDIALDLVDLALGKPSDAAAELLRLVVQQQPYDVLERLSRVERARR